MNENYTDQEFLNWAKPKLQEKLNMEDKIVLECLCSRFQERIDTCDILETAIGNIRENLESL